MKNLVKKAKSNQWKSIVVGIIAGLSFLIIAYYFLILPIENYNVKKVYWLMLILISVSSWIFGHAVHLNINYNIWKNVYSQIKSNNKLRNITHIRLIEDCINNGNMIDAEKYLESYKKAKYHTDSLINYFYGAIQSKFYPKLLPVQLPIR